MEPTDLLVDGVSRHHPVNDLPSRLEKIDRSHVGFGNQKSLPREGYCEMVLAPYWQPVDDVVRLANFCQH